MASIWRDVSAWLRPRRGSRDADRLVADASNDDAADRPLMDGAVRHDNVGGASLSRTAASTASAPSQSIQSVQSVQNNAHPPQPHQNSHEHPDSSIGLSVNIDAATEPVLDPNSLLYSAPIVIDTNHSHQNAAAQIDMCVSAPMTDADHSNVLESRLPLHPNDAVPDDVSLRYPLDRQRIQSYYDRDQVRLTGVYGNRPTSMYNTRWSIRNPQQYLWFQRGRFHGMVYGSNSASIGHTNMLHSGINSSGHVYDDVSDLSTSGMRIWYRDYTTIDWMHDHVKDRIRVQAIRNLYKKDGYRYHRSNHLRSVRYETVASMFAAWWTWITCALCWKHVVNKAYGKLVLYVDASQAWIVLTIVGCLSGLAAGFVDMVSSWLNDVKRGVCGKSVWLRYDECCGSTNGNGLVGGWYTTVFQKQISREAFNQFMLVTNDIKNGCSNWKTWPELLSVSAYSDSDAIDNLVSMNMYVVLGVLFALVSSMCVMWSATHARTSDDRDHRSVHRSEQRRQQTTTNSPARNRDYGAISTTDSSYFAHNSSRSTQQNDQREWYSSPSAQRDTLSAHYENLSNLASRPVHKVLYPAGGSGVPEVKTILSGFVIRGFLGVRTLVTKTIGLVFSIASGLVIGMQGPLVHIACAIGNVTSRLFIKYAKNEGKRREIMSAACAAGVSVAFGAPIGGVLFSLEEVSYYFPLKTMWRSFYCAMVAAVMLKFLNPFGTGKLVMFQVSYDRPWRAIELVPFFVLGVVGGVVGALFIRATTGLAKFRAWMGVVKYPVLEVMLIALVTSVINYAMPITRGGHGELVAALFSECPNGRAHNNTMQGGDDYNNENMLCQSTDLVSIMTMLGLAMISKFVLMIVTFGIRVPGGIFVPSMVVGACAGRIMGILVQYLYRLYPTHPIVVASCGTDDPDVCVIPGVYAMVGAAAALSGTTRMTVSLTVIMFELTGALTYVLPFMISIMVAKWVGDAFGRESIYDVVIHRLGYPYINQKTAASHGNVASDDLTEDDVSMLATASDVMASAGDTVVVDRVYRVDELRRKLETLDVVHGGSKDAGLPVVRENGNLVGYIAQTELEHALDMACMHDLDENEDDQQVDQVERPDSSVVIRSKLNSNHFGAASTRGDSLSGQSDDDQNDVVDISHWVDKTPLIVSDQASIDLVIELFVKLGARTVCVVREGAYVGLIHKKRLIAFLRSRASSKSGVSNI